MIHPTPPVGISLTPLRLMRRATRSLGLALMALPLMLRAAWLVVIYWLTRPLIVCVTRQDGISQQLLPLMRRVTRLVGLALIALPLMLRAAWLVGISLMTVALASAAEPWPPSRISFTMNDQPRTVGDALQLVARQTGMKVKGLGINLKQPLGQTRLEDQSFWGVLDLLAQESNSRIGSDVEGTELLLVAGRARTAASHDGPFRVQASQVQAVMDPQSGDSRYDLSLQVLWEPRLAVFRMDAQPRLSRAVDDRGRSLTAAERRHLVPVQANCSHTLTMRLQGLDREAKLIRELAGSLRVTAAGKQLDFVFEPLPLQLPVVLQQAGVEVRLVRLEQTGRNLDCELLLIQPEGHPQFESFESWTTRTRLSLISPDRFIQQEASLQSRREAGREARLVFQFDTAPRQQTGWILAARTPAAIAEGVINFRLTDLPLP